MDIYLVPLLKFKFKDAQTPARLVECLVGKQSNALSPQMQVLTSHDPILRGTFCFVSAPMLPGLLS